MATQTDERLEEFRVKFLPKLVDTFQPVLVLAFASRARGDALKHSDLDLLIVSEAFCGIRWLDHPARIIKELGLSVGGGVLCYTPQSQPALE